MSNLKFYDAAYPPSPPPGGFDGVAFYIGGDTPHVWTLAEIEEQDVRFRLPIFTRSNPTQAEATTDVADAVAQLKVISAPKGCLVAWDSETSVDPNYMAEVFYGLASAGYKLIDYGSQSTVFGNQNPDGYYWGGDWTDVTHISPGDQMTQWESLNSYDESTALATLPFWDTQKPSGGGGEIDVIEIPGVPGEWIAVWYYVPDQIVIGQGTSGAPWMYKFANGEWTGNVL